ncbi:MAG: metabolite traffic protein EboE [bacterium]
MQRGPLHLTYCTNVHPGETLAELLDVLRGPVADVKARFAPSVPFGLGLRLGNTATSALLRSPAALLDLAEACLEEGLYVFTVNGFPYGDFAAESVKAAVYDPGWLDPERVAYTLRLARVLSRLPGPARRTISTVAGGFRPATDGAQAHRQIAAHLRQAVDGLRALADETGVSIRLCLEPEPWTTLETTADAIAFFQDHLDGPGDRAHLGLCYDCCHQAVHFEDAAESVQALVAAEVPIGKVQVSSALHLAAPADPAARAALAAFAEPRYLHQVVARTPDGRLLRAVDLPEVPWDYPEWRGAEAWRCHFHVPTWWGGDGPLGTTRADWQQAVRAVLATGACTHLEVETYTWHVLPAAEQAALEGGDLVACVDAELRALLAVIE